MKVPLVSALATVLLVLGGCSAEVPSEQSIRTELQRRIAAESNGCMRLVETEKTNGYEAPSMPNAYVVVFNATIEFAKDCKWSTRMFEQGKHKNFATTITDAQARQKGGYWSEFFNMSQNPGAPFTEGTRVRVAGEQAFVKTEKGYQPLTDMFAVEELGRIFSDRDIRMALIAQFDPWDEAMYSWYDAAQAANPGAQRIKGISDFAAEVAERGGSSEEIRAAVEKELVPRFLKEIPKEDGWGNTIDYLVDVKYNLLFLRSPGKDGKSSWVLDDYQKGMQFYDPEDYDGDLVWYFNGTDSYFVHGPDIQEVNPFSDVPG